MIPKTIHYCWFGGKEKPPGVNKRIEEWKAMIPDYEIKEWNEDNFDVWKMAYTREAYLSGNYAFVADVCRLVALYEYGGIYLDTDIEVVKRFDKFLSETSFVGYEHQQTAWIGTGVIGAERGAGWIKEFINIYKHRHFINAFGHAVRTPNTKLLTLHLMPNLSREMRPRIYDVDYFCAKDTATGKLATTVRTVCIHHFACSWARGKRNLAIRAKLIMQGLKIRYYLSKRRNRYERQ